LKELRSSNVFACPFAALRDMYILQVLVPQLSNTDVNKPRDLSLLVGTWSTGSSKASRA
jgi:hypothetical protein